METRNAKLRVVQQVDKIHAESRLEMCTSISAIAQWVSCSSRLTVRNYTRDTRAVTQVIPKTCSRVQTALREIIFGKLYHVISLSRISRSFLAIHECRLNLRIDIVRTNPWNPPRIFQNNVNLFVDFDFIVLQKCVQKYWLSTRL